MKLIHKNLARLRYATLGIAYALQHDASYRTQFYGLGAIVALYAFFFSELSETELLVLILAWMLVLITELQNTAFEAALDHIHPELHERIGRSKDMAAGAVLTAGVFLAIVMVVIAW